MADISLDKAMEIATLMEHPGYQVLMAYFDEEIESVLSDVESAETDEQERRAVSHWRSLRATKRILESMPANIKDQIEARKLNPNASYWSEESVGSA